SARSLWQPPTTESATAQRTWMKPVTSMSSRRTASSTATCSRSGLRPRHPTKYSDRARRRRRHATRPDVARTSDVYDPLDFVALAEAEAIITDVDSWGGWMIGTTEAGNALLGAPTEW